MKNISGLLKTVVIALVAVCLLAMALINHNFLWKQTRMARAFYFVWQGDESLKKDNFQAAIDYYKTALKIYPEHPKAHYNLGNIYFWYEVYTASPEKQPVKVFKYDKNLDRFVLHIEPHEETQDEENSAEAAYIMATEVYPDFINAWINLGLVRVQQYDLDGAIKAFMQATNANPVMVNIPFLFNNEPSIKYNRAVAYYNLAHVYKQKALATDYTEIAQDYYLQAMNYYQKSYEINPDNYKTNYNLAQTYHVLERDTPAINKYCEAIKIDPFKYEAHYNLGILLKSQDRYIAASDEIKKAAMLLDFSDDSNRAEYVFRILSDISFRGAAHELSQRRHFWKTYYPIPQKGIIAEVIGKPLIKEKQKMELQEKQTLKEKEEANKKEQKENKKDKPLVKQDLAYEEFSACVTDPDYYDNLKAQYEKHPDWIYLYNTPLTEELYKISD